MLGSARRVHPPSAQTPQVRNPIGLNIKICMHTFNFIADFAELDSIQLIAIIQPREAFLHVALFLLVNP